MESAASKRHFSKMKTLCRILCFFPHYNQVVKGARMFPAPPSPLSAY